MLYPDVGDTYAQTQSTEASGIMPSDIDISFHFFLFRYELEYGAQDFIGVMDEIRIWSTVRSQAQIQEVCTPGCCHGFVTRWGGGGEVVVGVAPGACLWAREWGG